MTLFRGLHDDVTLNDWLYKYIFPAEAKNVNEEFVRWGTRLAAAEQIRVGRDDVRRYVLLRGCGRGGDEGGGNARRAGRDVHRFPCAGQQERSGDAGVYGEISEAVAGRSADSCGSGSAFDLYVFEEDTAGCGRAGEEISRADFDSRVGDEEGVGGQREGERDVSGAVSGEDWGARAGHRGGALHFCG